MTSILPGWDRVSQPARLSIEVVDDLVRSRPLGGRDHEVDLTATEPVKRMIRRAACLDAHRSQLIPPGDSRSLILERADRLPGLDPWIADENRVLPGEASLQESRAHHPASVRAGRAAGDGRSTAPAPITSVSAVSDADR